MKKMIIVKYRKWFLGFINGGSGWSSTKIKPSVCVCVCVCVVSVCVCVFMIFHRKGFFCLQWCLGHTWEYRSMILCCEYYSRCFCQVPSSPFPKMSYFTSKDETPKKIIKKICLFYLNVFVSLRRALLVDALGETS